MRATRSDNQGGNRVKENFEIKQLLNALLLALGWAFVLLSIAVYLLFWRVDNEPGAGSATGVLIAAIAMLSVGGLSVIANAIYLIVRKAWIVIVIAGAVCLVILVGAISLAPILLLLMV